MNTCRILVIFLSATLASAALSQRVLAEPPPAVSSATETTLQQDLDLAREHEFRKALDAFGCSTICSTAAFVSAGTRDKSSSSKPFF